MVGGESFVCRVEGAACKVRVATGFALTSLLINNCYADEVVGAQALANGDEYGHDTAASPRWCAYFLWGWEGAIAPGSRDQQSIDHLLIYAKR